MIEHGIDPQMGSLVELDDRYELSRDTEEYDRIECDVSPDCIVCPDENG